MIQEFSFFLDEIELRRGLFAPLHWDVDIPEADFKTLERRFKEAEEGFFERLMTKYEEKDRGRVVGKLLRELIEVTIKADTCLREERDKEKVKKATFLAMTLHNGINRILTTARQMEISLPDDMKKYLSCLIDTSFVIYKEKDNGEYEEEMHDFFGLLVYEPCTTDAPASTAATPKSATELSLPEEFRSMEAKQIFSKMIEAGLMSKRESGGYTWHRKKALLAYWAAEVSDILKLGQATYKDGAADRVYWKPFEELFYIIDKDGNERKAIRLACSFRVNKEVNNTGFPREYEMVDKVIRNWKSKSNT